MWLRFYQTVGLILSVFIRPVCYCPLIHPIWYDARTEWWILALLNLLSKACKIWIPSRKMYLTYIYGLKTNACEMGIIPIKPQWRRESSTLEAIKTKPTCHCTLRDNFCILFEGNLSSTLTLPTSTQSWQLTLFHVFGLRKYSYD